MVLSPDAKKHKSFASIGTAIILICFFLPRIVVSCGVVEVKITGNELASGNISIGNGDETVTGTLNEMLDSAGLVS